MLHKKWFIFLTTFLSLVLVLIFYKMNTIALPSPTGLYSVGTTNISFIDQSREETHNPPNKREMVAQVWYPIDQKKYPQKPLPYLEHSIEYVKKAIAELKNIPFDQLNYVNSLVTHSYPKVAYSHKETTYPIILFSPGFGAPQETYTMILQDLASHGYIVFGINHPYVSTPTIFPDGRIIEPDPLLKKIETEESRKKTSAKLFEVWLKDLTFIIEQLPHINTEHQILHGALNLQQIGVMGHSFGGRVAVEICRTNPHVNVGIDLDGKLNPGTSLAGILKPFLFVLAERKDTTGLEQIQKLQKNSGPDVFVVVLKGAEHGTSSDLNYVFQQWFHTSLLDPLRGIKIIQKLLVTFCDSYLKNKKGNFSEEAQKIDPEIIIMT